MFTMDRCDARPQPHRRTRIICISLAGPSLAVLSQLLVCDRSPQCVSVMLKGVFFVLVLVSMAAQIHCVCNTTFITVWGGGLALRGPDGSVTDV